MWYYEILSPTAILVSACGAWWFACKAINSNRDVAKKKATFDYLTKLSWDDDYITAKNRFLELKAGPKKLRAVAEDYEAMKSDSSNIDKLSEIIIDHSSIKNILNEYEAMAIAVKSGALDEEMIRENIRQQFISHIESCSEFIRYSRNNSGFAEPEKIWCEVQLLSKKWAEAS